MRVWELHNVGLAGAIRTTPDGAADIAGLVLSEKAYLLVVRDFRPAQIVELVHRCGTVNAGARLVAHFNEPEALNANGGRGLASARAGSGEPGIFRSDEVARGELVGRGL